MVTGGASGLGEATVRRLVAEGAKALAVDLNEERGEALASEFPEQVLFSACDVTNEEQVVGAIDRAMSAFGRIDITVNCAGTGGVFRMDRQDVLDFVNSFLP